MKFGSGRSCPSWMSKPCSCLPQRATSAGPQGASLPGTLETARKSRGLVQSEAESEKRCRQKAEDEMQIFASRGGPADSVKGQV